MDSPPSSIRIAIVGGGIAGITLFHVLQQHPHLDVHIFESAPTFGQTGLAIGLSKNALSAIHLMGHSVQRSLAAAGAVGLLGRRAMMATGPDAFQLAQEVQARNHIVHRPAFLRELLRDAPAHRMHAGKKLIGVEQMDLGVRMKFADETTHVCDVLMGADGIHSYVRKVLLGEDDPAAVPVPVGYWRVCALKPIQEVQNVLGKEMVDPNEPREWGWLGDGGFILHNVLSGGEIAQFVAVHRCDDNDSVVDWKNEITAQELREVFGHFPPFLTQAIEKLLCDKPSQDCWYYWEHSHAREYAAGGVCIVGDAAHSMTPFQGSGAAMGLEDAFILSSLLGRATSVAQTRAALKAYDLVRRPRTQRVVDSSRETGKILTCHDPETGSNVTKVGEKLRTRWDFIFDLDMTKHRDEAFRAMDTITQTT